MLTYPYSKRGPALCRSCVLPGLFNFSFSFSTRCFCLLSLRPEARCPVVLPGGSTFSITSCSVYLCTYSLVLAVKTGRLVIQADSRAVADKSCAEGVPSPRSSVCFLRLGLYLSTWDIFLSHYFSSFSISAPSLPIFLSPLNYKNYIIIFFICPNTSHFLPIRLSWTNALSNPAFI